VSLLPAAVTDTATTAAYRLGFGAVRRLPERAAYPLFDRIADVAVRRGAGARLRANYATVRPDLAPDELDRLTTNGMRATLRYYCEAFRLPELSADDLAARVRLEGDGPVREVVAAGGSAVCFLGHLGNWDLAGAWATVHWAPVTTVAERLEPAEVFDEFLEFRSGLGMTILPLTGGPPVFPALREAARRPGLIPLLADRDLTRRGVVVDFCGEPARMAPGPAALALVERRPLFPVSIRHERRPSGGWGIVIRFHDRVAVPAEGTTAQRVHAMTQACADAVGSVVRRHPADWHMLQRVFVRDLDPARLSPVDGGPTGEGVTA
jgi:KDO2-lipid IV(A) lauroyltransferase